MKFIKYGLFALIAVLPACSDANQDVPISVSYYIRHGNFGSYPNIQITAETDQITIEDLEINRGNCLVLEKRFAEIQKKGMSLGHMKALAQVQRTLNFGEVTEYSATVECKAVKEVSVVTDKGTWTFNFN